MQGSDLHDLLVEPLQRTGIPHMVTGGLAAILYGEPRLTNDVDIVLEMTPHQASRLVEVYPSAEYYLPPLEVLREEASRPRAGHFNIMHLETALRADMYCLAEEDAAGHWAMEHRHVLMDEGGEMSVAPIEYVILRKLEYFSIGGSDRHIRDIRSMLRLSGARIDFPELERWINREGLGSEWEHVSSH